MPLLDLFCCEGGASQGYIDGGLELLAGIDNKQEHINAYNKHFPGGKGHLMDWRDGLEKFGPDASLIHASPPCQRFSSQSRDRARAEEKWENLIPPVREALRQTGKPYVIENVAGAKSELHRPFMLNGFMFPELRIFWPPSWPDQEEKIAREAVDGHWIKCNCRFDPEGKKHPAYWCEPVPRNEVPYHWTIKRNRYFEISGFPFEPPPDPGKPPGYEVMSVTVSPNPTMVWNKINRQSVPLPVRRQVMGVDDPNWMSARGVGECIPPPYTRYIAQQFLSSTGKQ